MHADKFMNPLKHPADADMRKRIGKPYQLLEDTIAGLESEYEGIGFDWKFSKTSGWYLVCERKKRRIFYLFSSVGGFVMKIVFGDRAFALVKDTSGPNYLLNMIAKAKHYPEGTLLEFDEKNFDPPVVQRLLEIKIEN